MSELGDFVELLERGGRSFSTLHAEYRETGNPEVTQRAIADAMSRSRGDRTRVRQPVARDRVDAEALGPTSRRADVWLDIGGRYREEIVGAEGTELLICDGERWWRLTPMFGASSNADGDEGVPLRPRGAYEALVDPAGLAARMWFELVGDSEVAGRPTRRVRATPQVDEGAPGHSGQSGLDFGRGADEYEFEVDAEYGVVLRAVARFKGELLGVVEAVEVCYDVRIDAETFVFTAPDGAEPTFEPPLKPVPVPLHVAGSTAPFSVFALAGMPDGWVPFAMFAAARQRPPRPAELTIMYVESGDGGTVIVRQQDEADAVAAAAADHGGEHPVQRTVERGVGTVSVLAESAGFQTVRVVRGGTRVEIASAGLDVEQLLELSDRLEPTPE